MLVRVLSSRVASCRPVPLPARGPLCMLALALVFASLGGCSSDHRFGVEGRVTYAGEPIELGSITFLPEDEKSIKGGGIIVKGQYKVEPSNGLNPGQHRVQIRWAKPTGKKYKNEFGEVLDVRQEGLPEKYHTKSSLTAVIKAGPNRINFDLEK
jgi:hypothetical protein